MNKYYQENNAQNYPSNKRSEESEDMDLKDLTEIDIFSKKYGFNEEFVDRMLKPDCKWSEKKEAFDRLTKCTDPTKIKAIKNSDRTYFIEMIKKLLKQPNINVVHSIINALNNLSLGLSHNFFEAKDLFLVLLNFLKEKKESIINSLINCLSNFALIMNDNIINEKFMYYCSGKQLCNNAKINLCTLLEKIIDKKRNNIQLNIYTNLLLKISKFLEDQNPEVREKSSKFMAYINFIKKDLFNLIANSINLDNKKRDKIIQYEKLYINSTYNKSLQNNEIFLNNQNISNKKDNINIKKKKIGKKLIDYENINPLNNTSDENNIELIKENLITNKEEIISYVQKNIENLNNSLFNSLKWNERKEGFSLLNKFINTEKNFEEIMNGYDYYFKYILLNNKFFNEKNFLVLNESIFCIISLIDKVDEFSKRYYKIIIPLILNKLNEKKVFPEIQNLILKLIQKISSKEIIITFINNLENKTIIIVKEGIELLKNIINGKYEINEYPLQEIINFSIEHLNDTNNILKKSSTQLLICIYMKIGEDIMDYLSNVNENTVKILKEEFNKIENTSNKKIDENSEKSIIEIDISEKISESIIKDLNEGKWFEKKKAIEQIEEIISQSNHNILSKGLNDLFYAIKNNLNDGNKNIVKLSIKLVSELIEALSPGLNLKFFINIIFPELLSNFSDNKTSIKDQAVTCVNKILELIGIDQVINYFGAHLKAENFEIKNEILKLLIKNKNTLVNQKDNKDLLYPLINCLLDKNTNIRNNAKIIIQEMMQYISPNLINDYIIKLKPSHMKQINDIIFDISSNNSSKKNSKLPLFDNPKTEKKTKSKNLISDLSKQNETISKVNLQSTLKKYSRDLSPFKVLKEKENLLSSGKKSISKSPILPTKSNLSKYNYNIIDVLPPELEELPNYIHNLEKDDIPLKIISLTEIKKILLHINTNDFVINQITDILNCFNKLIYSINTNLRIQKDAIDKNEIALLRYLLDDYIFIANIKSLINFIEDKKLIYNCYEKLFLLISEKELNSIAQNSEIISILNTTILCLLTNFDKSLTIISLISIISNYKSSQEFSLISSLAIKCLNKFRKILPKIHNKLNINEIFISFYEFFLEFSRTNKNLEINNESEKNALLMINSMIKEFINIYGDDIWSVYKNSLDDDMLKMDVYLKRNIEILLKENNSEKIMENNCSFNFNFEPNIKDENDEIINEILNNVNKIKSEGNIINEDQINNYYFEIISLLRINKINIDLFKDKIDKNILDKIFELYYGIKERNESQESLPFYQDNKILENNFINKKQIKKKEISEQSKRIMDYKNKIKNLTESNKIRNKKTSVKVNDENKPINHNMKFVENNMKQLDEISFQNKNKGDINNTSTFDEIIKMKKKLEEIRQKIN